MGILKLILAPLMVVYVLICAVLIAVTAVFYSLNEEGERWWK
jgi:hypothetical protein